THCRCSSTRTCARYHVVVAVTHGAVSSHQSDEVAAPALPLVLPRFLTSGGCPSDAETERGHEREGKALRHLGEFGDRRRDHIGRVAGTSTAGDRHVGVDWRLELAAHQ